MPLVPYLIVKMVVKNGAKKTNTSPTQKYVDSVVELDLPYDDLDVNDGELRELAAMDFGEFFSGGPVSLGVNQEVAVEYVPNDSCKESYPGPITLPLFRV